MPVDPAVPPWQLHQRSPALVVAGALMITAGLLLANPGAGATATLWPWQILAQWPWQRFHANWAIWFLAAGLAIALGATLTRRPRAPLLLGLALLLSITCTAGDAGLALTKANLTWIGGLSLLMAGFLLEAEGRWRDAARACCALGALVTLATIGLKFERLPTGEPQSLLAQIVQDVATRVTGGGVPDAKEHYDIELFANASAILAAVVGLGPLLGLRGGLVARLGVVMVLLHFLVPTFHRLGVQLGGRFEAGGVFTTLSEVLIHYGFALCLFLAAAAADLARLQTRAT